MSEGKRIQLTSMPATATPPLSLIASGGALLPPSTAISASLIGSSGATASSIGHATGFAGNKQGTDFLPQVAKVMEKANNSRNKPTTRLTIELFQSDSSKYPEFNYTRLLRLEKKKQKKIKQKTCNNPGFAFNNSDDDGMDVDQDDDVVRIAREMEKKYGSAYGSGIGSRSNKKRDTYDIGMGYDENDSFIDNTEAYDEIIPNELETVEGGFYINCGALIYKKLYNDQMNTKTDEIIKMPERPKKMIISSSSEEDLSSSAAENDDDDDDDDNNDNGNDDNEEDDDDDDEDEDDDDDEDDEEDDDDKNDKNDCNTDNDVEKESTSGKAMLATPLLTASATTTMVSNDIVADTLTTTSTSASTLASTGKDVTGFVTVKNINLLPSDLPAKRKLPSMENITNVKKNKKDKSGSSSNNTNDLSSLNQHYLPSMITDTVPPVLETCSNTLSKERSLKKHEKTTTVKDMLKIQRDNFLKSQNTIITPTLTSGTITASTTPSTVQSVTISPLETITSDQHNTALKPAATLVNNYDNQEKMNVQDECASSLVVINLDDIHMRVTSAGNNAASGNGVSDVNYESDSNSSNQSNPKIVQNDVVMTNNNQLEDISGSDKLRNKDTKLPQLDSQLLNLINDFRKFFQEKNLLAKKFKISEQYMTDLLSIDNLLLGGYNKSQRNNVYAHLEYHLHLPKYSILRKIKQMRIKEEKAKQVNAFYKLQKSVLEVMTIAAANYHIEMSKYTDMQKTNTKGGVKLSCPDKKFPWSNEIRSQLYELFQLRSSSYSTLATRNETWDDFVYNFIRLKVLPIWPHDWMTYEELCKEIENCKNYKEKINNNSNNNCINYNNCNISESGNNKVTTVTKIIEENCGAINNPNNFNVAENCSSAIATSSISTIGVGTSVPVTVLSSLSAGPEINNRLNLLAGSITSSNSSYKIHSVPSKQQFSSILEQQHPQQQQQHLPNSTSHSYINYNFIKTSPSNLNSNNFNKTQTAISAESITHAMVDQQSLDLFRQMELLKMNNINLNSKNIYHKNTNNSNNKTHSPTIKEEATAMANEVKTYEINSPDSEIEFVNVVYPAVEKLSINPSESGGISGMGLSSAYTSPRKKIRYIDTIVGAAADTATTTIPNKHKQ